MPSPAATETPAPAARRSSATPATASRDEADAPDASASDESFESATLVALSVLADRDVDREETDDRPSAARPKPPPPLDDVVAKIPAETKDALEQLFRARFRTVRRITPEQLR